MNTYFLRKNSVDIYFLMKYCMLGDANHESEIRSKFMSLAKDFFSLASLDDLDEKEMKSFNFKKQELLNSVFEIHHEINEDDMRLEFERKILVFDYEKNQREPIISDLPKINTVSVEDFFNE